MTFQKKERSVKKITLLVQILSVTALIISACGGGQEEKGAARRPGPPRTTGKVLTWVHIPIYPGAAEASSDVLQGHPDYNRMEMRKFISQDTPDKIRAYYLQRMPDGGWRDFGAEDIEDVHQMIWGTDDRNTMCWVRIKELGGDDGVELEIVRAQGKK
jgi:hypothetical protein